MTHTEHNAVLIHSPEGRCCFDTLPEKQAGVEFSSVRWRRFSKRCVN